MRPLDFNEGGEVGAAGGRMLTRQLGSSRAICVTSSHPAMRALGAAIRGGDR